jgi:hypothetical protein
MEITILILLIWAHFVGDFILQSNYLALNKSKDNLVLVLHVSLYMLPFIVLALLIPINWIWLLINWILHFCTDYVSSRITRRFSQMGKEHWFFVTIGADQAVHITCLMLTYSILIA